MKIRSANCDRYSRIARWYDAIQAPMDWLGGAHRRQRVIGQAGGRVLEVGIGTGLNLDFYAAGIRLIGIDISAAMLDRARDRAAHSRREVELMEADVECLPFPNHSFDTVTATCVFCSVDDPVAGLREVRRVLKAGGRALLLEHVRPRNAILGAIADTVSPITRRLMGPEINRRTEENILAAGLTMLEVRRDGIWREIVACPLISFESE